LEHVASTEEEQTLKQSTCNYTSFWHRHTKGLILASSGVHTLLAIAGRIMFMFMYYGRQ